MSHSTARAPQSVMLGVTLIIVTTFAISVQDVVFKLFASELTLWQIFSLRGLLAVPALAVLALALDRSGTSLKAAFGRWAMVRAVFITGTFLAFYAAIPFLSLSTVGAANYTAPIFVTLLSAYAIKEPVRVLGWIGVVIGFVGVLVLLRPGSDAFSTWTLLPILGACSYAVAHIITRKKCQDVSVTSLSLAQNTMMLVAGLIMSFVIQTVPMAQDLVRAYPYLFGSWARVEPADWGVIVVLAAFAVGLGMMLSAAYKVAPPTIVATCEYSYLVFVAAWDVLFFETVLSRTAIAGSLLIVLSGLLVSRKGSKE